MAGDAPVDYPLARQIHVKSRARQVDSYWVTLASHRPLKLRHPAVCIGCGCELLVGADAWWDRTEKAVTCLTCELQAPADPWAAVDPALQGVAGGSAELEYQRRQGRRNGSGESWRKGAEGEQKLAGILHAEAGSGHLMVLDDRLIPGSKANIDHIAIARSGIYVIDAKKYKGRIERKATGFGRNRREQLIVNGRDRTKLANAMERQVTVVSKSLDAIDGRSQPDIIPVLCFVDGEWDLFMPSFTVAGVNVTWPRALRKMLRREGPLGGTERAQLARLLSVQLPPAVEAAD